MRMFLLAVLNCGIACGQQLAFTSRAYIQSPVVISSIQSSKEFGFDSVVLRNDGPASVTAVHFKIVVRAGNDIGNAEEEVADERRVAVALDRTDIKRVVVSLGHVTGLKQQAKARKQDAALVILTIESVEFEDGGEWRQTEQGEVPLDPRGDEGPPLRRK